MKKTKDEVLMEALGVTPFSIMPKFQRVQLYYALDEWASIIQTAQLQQHGVGGPASASGSEGEQLPAEGQGEANMCADCGAVIPIDEPCYSCEYGAMFGH